MVNAARTKYRNPRYFRGAASPYNWIYTTCSTYTLNCKPFWVLSRLWLFAPTGRRGNRKSGHRVEFAIFKCKIRQVLGGDWTTLRALRAANDAFSFDFKDQLQRYPLLIIPLIIPLYAPQVDRMDFLLVDYIFRCDP